MKKILLIMMAMFLGACSSLTIDTNKHKVEPSELNEPFKVMDEILIRECLLSDWYNEEEPVHYLTTRQIIKPDGDEIMFLESLKTKGDIDSDDVEEFNKLTEKYLNKLERTYELKDENIKNTKSILQKLVIGYNVIYPTMEKHLMTVVASEEERAYIQEQNKLSEDELTDKDRKKLRKLLNTWMERKEFFDMDSLYNIEISEATTRLAKLSKKKNLTSLELNNLNAKTMEITLGELVSELNKWGK